MTPPVRPKVETLLLALFGIIVAWQGGEPSDRWPPAAWGNRDACLLGGGFALALACASWFTTTPRLAATTVAAFAGLAAVGDIRSPGALRFAFAMVLLVIATVLPTEPRGARA